MLKPYCSEQEVIKGLRKHLDDSFEQNVIRYDLLRLHA